MRRFVLYTMVLALLIVPEVEGTPATIIDFSTDLMTPVPNPLSLGQIIDDEFAHMGLTISTENFRSGHPDIGIIFDSSNPTGDDWDLETPSTPNNGNRWYESLGNFLIIAEDDVDNDNDGFIDDPDDEGRRPAGEFTFDFQPAIESFGFYLVDVENVEAGGGYFASFLSNGTEVYNRTFSSLAGLDRGSGLVVFGDNTINRIDAFNAYELGTAPWDQVIIRLGGSGAVDNIQFSYVPEPSTFALFGLGAFGLLGYGWRRRKQMKK